MVTLFNFSLPQIDFPSLPDQDQKYYADLGCFLPAGTKQILLDRLPDPNDMTEERISRLLQSLGCWAGKPSQAKVVAIRRTAWGSGGR